MATIAHVRGRITGAGILTLFGAVWCGLALAFWSARPGWSVPAGALAAAALLAFCVARLVALRGVPSIENPAEAARWKRIGMWFGIIFGIEGGLIALCSVMLARAGLDTWIPIAAAVIVGLHFLPLARLFQMPAYFWMGAVIVVAMIGCSLIRDAGARQLCAGLMVAVVLWLTALVVLLQSGPHAVR